MEALLAEVGERIVEVEVGLLDLTQLAVDDHLRRHINTMKSLFKRVDAIGHDYSLKLVILSKTIDKRLNNRFFR